MEPPMDSSFCGRLSAPTFWLRFSYPSSTAASISPLLPPMAIRIPLALLTLPVIVGLLPSHTTADHVLYTSEVLIVGQNLTNGKHRLAMQSNCDLVVLYQGETPTWRANTAGKDSDCYLRLKHNGELIVRRNVHYTVWSSSNKSKKGRHALMFGGKGKLGIDGRKQWATNNQKETGTVLDRPMVSTEDREAEGERREAAAGERIH